MMIKFSIRVKNFPLISQTGPVGGKIIFIHFYAQKKKLKFGENSYTHVHKQNLFTHLGWCFSLCNLCLQEANCNN